jgi:hypothetical protein
VLSAKDGQCQRNCRRGVENFQISVQHFDSMWFIEIQVRLVIFVAGRNCLASGVARAVPDWQAWRE